MLWPTKSRSKQLKARNKQRRRSDLQSCSCRRSVRFEPLEDRRLLAVDVLAPGGGSFSVVESAVLPGSSDQVLIAPTGTAGEFRISGQGSTQVQLNGGALVSGPEGVLVTTITGNVIVALGGGANSLTVAENITFPASFGINNQGVNDTNTLQGTNPPVTIFGDLVVVNAPGTSNSFNNLQVLGSVVINNHNGNTNAITNSTINGGLWVSKQALIGPGQSILTIGTSTVVGPTIVTNVNPGNNGGDTTTTVTNSQLIGQTTAVPAQVPGYVAAVPAGLAMRVINGPGDDKLSLLGTTQVGTQLLVAPPTVLTVSNGDGGSMTTLGPVNQADATHVDVNGNMTIRNGLNLPNSVDMAMFVQADIDGALGIYNDGGPGATNTMFANSNIGTWLAPPGPGPFGRPAVIINDDGQDSLTMTGSTAWWGLFVDHDNDPTGVNPPTPWPSNTQISSSDIGTRPGGPSNAAGLAAVLAAVFPGPAFQLPGLIAPGDALVVLGGSGSDTINVNPTQVGGQISLLLGNGGINNVTLMGSADNPLVYPSIRVVGGTGNDTVRLENISIPINLLILLDGGNDTLELAGNTTLPAAGVGTILINGGVGLDTLTIEDSVVLPVDFFTLLGVLSGFNP